MKDRGLPKKLAPLPMEPVLSSPDDWSKAVKAEFDRYRKALRRKPKQLRENGIGTFDYTEAMSKRRMAAIVNTIPQIYQRFRPYGGHHNTLGRQWIDLNMPLASYSQMDTQSHIMFAAALWALDRIMEQEDWRRIYRYLPRSDKDIEDLFLPDVWDCRYEYELISSVEYVLRYRNRDAGGIEDDTQGNERILTSDVAARGEIPTDGESRKNYEALIGMIPQEKIDEAVSHFTELFWRWVEKTVGCMRVLADDVGAADKKIVAARDAFNQAIDEANRLMDETEKRAEERKAKPNPLLVKPNPLLARPEQAFGDPLAAFPSGRSALAPLPGLPGEFMRTADALMSATDRIERMGERIDELIDEAQNAKKAERQFMFRIVREGRVSRTEDKEKFSAETDIADLCVSDPYELCFALLWLIESGSDIPWLYGACLGFMGEVVESLPWGVIEYDEEDDTVWSGDEDDEPAELPRSIVIPDWHERKYHYRGDEFDFPRSLAQIVYEEAGVILPRDLHLYDRRARELTRYGVKGKDAANLLVLMAGLSAARRQVKALNFDSDLDLILGDSDENRHASEQKTEQEDPERLKEEVRKLRAALHESERAARDARKELASIKAMEAKEHRELADLREVVFNREEAGEEEEPTPDGEWPYAVQKDTVVFGGHATWARGIKSLLEGNIRFIDKDLVFDTGIVRHAEVIWIQPNALSHPMYWRIVDTARMHGKPVRYFTYAGWTKCAEQVRENDGQ